jgi:hypothetical protein
LVAAVGLDQAPEGAGREAVRAQRGLQAPQQRVRGAAPEGALELGLQRVEQRQPVALGLVAQRVRQAREAVQGQQVATQRGRQQAQRDGEVLVARPRQQALVCAS